MVANFPSLQMHPGRRCERSARVQVGTVTHVWRSCTVNKCTPIFAAGKVIGQVIDGAFCKRMQGSRHFLQKPPSICLDVQSLADAQKAGARLVKVIDTETGKTYSADIATIRKHSQKLDRGHGQQLALALGRWSCEDPQVTHRQLDLFSLAGAGR